MDDQPNEHEAGAAAELTGDAVASDSVTPSAAVGPGESAEPADAEAPDRLSAATAAALGVPGIAAPDPWAAFTHDQIVRAAATSTRRKKRMLITSVAVVIILAAVIGGAVATSGGPSAPGSGMAPADFVVSSTQTTLAQRTADVTYSGTVTADGQDVPLNGTGQVDFDTNTYTATLNENVSSTTFAIRELIASGQFYMGMTIDGHDMSEFTGGAHWVSISLPDQSSSSGLGAANVDPISQLKNLEQKGATVTSLGTKTIDGITVSGYSVTPTRQEVENELQQEVQQNKITAITAQQMQQAPDLLGSFTTEVWIDGSGLVRQENVNIAGGSAGITAKATVSFQNYGTPVSISTPAPSDVIPFNSFLNDLKALQASSQG